MFIAYGRFKIARRLQRPDPQGRFTQPIVHQEWLTQFDLLVQNVADRFGGSIVKIQQYFSSL